MAPVDRLWFIALAASPCGLAKRLMEEGLSAEGNRPLEVGHCATYEFDMYKPEKNGICYMRTYKCSDMSTSFRVRDQNTGDISWALDKECWHYGKYLHVWRVQVAKVSLMNGSRHYKQCNRSPKYGSLCDCGLKVDTDEKLKKQGCPPPRPWEYAANVFGWRTKQYKTGIFHQFSFPRKAMGSVDPQKTAEFLNEKGYKKHGPKDGDATFQWKQDRTEFIVDIAACLKKHVSTGMDLKDASDDERKDNLGEMIRRFQRAVVDGEEPECGKPAQ